MASSSFTILRNSPRFLQAGAVVERHTLQLKTKRPLISCRLLFHRQFASSSSSSTTRVGFIGLGNMGLPMSLNLAREQDTTNTVVVAFDVNPASCEKAEQGGMQIATSAASVGRECDVIFTMLPGCASVDATMNEMMMEISSSSSSSSNSKVIVDCSTVSPLTSRNWHEQWSSNGHAMLDAPVSGGVNGASDGTLTFMIGSGPHHENNGLDRARPYMELMGARLIACGGPGTGSATKLCNNLALAAQMIGICEAMNLGEALQVDPVVLANVMNQSTAKCWSCEVSNPHPAVAMAMKKSSHNGTGPPASREYEGGFGTKLMLKDLGLAVAAANEVGVAIPLGGVSQQLYRMALAHGLGDKDFGVILQLLKGQSPTDRTVS